MIKCMKFGYTWKIHAFIKVSIGSFYAISLWEKERIKIAFVPSDRNIKSAYITI